MQERKIKLPFTLRAIQWLYPKLERFIPSLAYRLFVQIFFTPFNFEAPVKEKKAETFGSRFTFTVANKKIQGYRWGTEGRIILLIHGWAGRATQFRRFIKPLLTAGYQVVGFDGPAHGNSQGISTNLLEFEECLKNIYQLIGKPEAIIAHSFGGPVSLVSAMHGLPVKTVITIASPNIADDIVNSYAKVIGGSEKSVAYFKEEVIRRTGKPFYEFSSLYAIQQIKKPINLMLVYDENDREISLEHPKALLDVFPSAKYIQTSGLGHNRILRDDQVISQIVTFINQYASVNQTKSSQIL